MNLDLNFINLLILLGAFQGLIFGVVLLFNQKHPGAKFLSVFMLVLSYNSFETYNWSSGLNNFITQLYPFVLTYALGPSLYLYELSLLYPEKKIAARTIVLFYSFPILQFIIRTGSIVYHILWVNDYIQFEMPSSLLNKFYYSYAEPLSVVVFIGYFIASVFLLRNYPAIKANRLLSKENQEKIYKWIKALLISMGILGILWPLTLLAPIVLNLPQNEKYYPVELLLVFFIYWIAFTGYNQSKQIYIKSSRLFNVDTNELELGFTKLKTALEVDKLFLDPELNLNKVALHTGLNNKSISAILNQYHQTTFNDFVNHYRILEAQQRLVDSLYQHLTISAIAFECGFNSQATFQRAFKAKVNMTPKEFIALQSKKMT